MNETDLSKYDEFVAATLKTWFKDEPADQVNSIPNLFASFMDASGEGTAVYNQVCVSRHCWQQRISCMAVIDK
jgi:hypothetical protein